VKSVHVSEPYPATQPAGKYIRIADAVHQALEDYFSQLDGHHTRGLYEMVLSEMERPLLKCVMHHCAGNQTRAAEVLGLNRGTLRKKLKHYGLL